MLRRLSTCRALQAAAASKRALPTLAAARSTLLQQTQHTAVITRSFASQSSDSKASQSREPPALFGTGGKYAQALFNAAKKRGGDTMNRVLTDIQKFQKAYTSNLQLAQLLDNPVLSADKKKEVVKKVSERNQPTTNQLIAADIRTYTLTLLHITSHQYYRLLLN